MARSTRRRRRLRVESQLVWDARRPDVRPVEIRMGSRWRSGRMRFGGTGSQHLLRHRSPGLRLLDLGSTLLGARIWSGSDCAVFWLRRGPGIVDLAGGRRAGEFVSVLVLAK